MEGLEPLRCYVRRQRLYRRGARPSDWLWFFTLPLVYSVWWRDDGTKTVDQFLLEQAELARAHRSGAARALEAR